MADEKSPDDLQETVEALFKEYRDRTKIKKTKILIVEDDGDIREVLRFQLAEAGYEVIEAEDGRNAIKIASTFCPDLILMDINMPGMNGIYACNLLKRNLNPFIKKLPVIMLTAQSSEDAVIAAVKAGADGYIVKPFEMEHVIRKIEEVLKKERKK